MFPAMEDLNMNVAFYEPYRLMNRLHRDLDRLMNVQSAAGDDEAVASWIPAIDIREEEKQFVLHADLPGVDPENIEVTLDNGVLTIRGRRELAERDERKGYRRVERISGEFYRRFSLPDTADSNSVKARHANGVLEVTIPKQAQVLPRRISVESA
jgi:HSP20 family protein